MKKLSRLLVFPLGLGTACLCLLLALPVSAQTIATPTTMPVTVAPATQAPPVATTTAAGFQPAYYVGAGSTYDYYGKTGFAAETNLAVRIGSTNVYSFSTMELGVTQATLRTGLAYLTYQNGNWAIVLIADAGLSTGSGITLGSVSGGPLILYDIGAKVSKGTSHAYIGVGMKMIQTASLGNQPAMVLTFGKGL